MIMKKLYRDDTLSSRKITHVLSPLPEVAAESAIAEDDQNHPWFFERLTF